MADESGANAQVPATVPDAPAAAETSAIASGAQKEAVPAADASASAPESGEKPAAEAKEPTAQPPQATAEASSDKPTEAADVEMKDAADTAGASLTTESAPAPSAETAPAAADAAAPTTPTMDKLKARRKSTGLGEGKGKKLAKKGSKARILHLDAKPGDHFFVKLKGYPQWPVVVCDDDMLPFTLLHSRPVSAKRVDGTYRDDFADGGKRAADRTFPVMYLHTNEFGWVPNSDLHDLDPTTVLDLVNDKMRKDLQKAHQLAAEAKPLSYYKDILREFQDNLDKQEAERREAQAAKKAKKSKPASAAEDEGDVEMGEADEETGTASEKKTKKRKAEDDAPAPQRADSVKKPKIKVISNSTPKSAANGTPTPKTTKSSENKPSKSKSKKEGKAEDKKVEKEAQMPKEPELSPEEKHQRKEKEVLFLRHKLQKGLLTRDQEPKAEEMKMMSDYITKLEGFPDLEVSIIRATKINKVLKAILKLESIPKEDEFHFKTRSQTLLDKWNKLLAVDVAPAAAVSKPAAADGAASSNGVNGKPVDKAAHKEGSPKADKTEVTNGIKENGEAKLAKAPAEPVDAKENKAKTEETATAAESAA